MSAEQTGAFFALVSVCSGLGSVLSLLLLLAKPVRERLFGLGAIREGQRCMLRADMLAAYYKHREEKTIRQYEYENFLYEYKAYKALHGNSFIERIAREVAEWESVTKAQVQERSFGGMEQFLKRIENLLTVKSIVTLALTAVFACQAVRGEVSQDFMMIYTTVIAFYFGTQAQKLQSGAETRHDDGASE